MRSKTFVHRKSSLCCCSIGFVHGQKSMNSLLFDSRKKIKLVDAFFKLTSKRSGRSPTFIWKLYRFIRSEEQAYRCISCRSTKIQNNKLYRCISCRSTRIYWIYLSTVSSSRRTKLFNRIPFRRRFIFRMRMRFILRIIFSLIFRFFFIFKCCGVLQ